MHPDFAFPNIVAAPDRLVLVDWTGAGWGPRIWSLAFALFAAGARGPARLDLFVAGYRRHATPEPEELARLAGLLPVRLAVLEVWALCVGRQSAADTLEGVRWLRQRGEELAERAVTAFRSP